MLADDPGRLLLNIVMTSPEYVKKWKIHLRCRQWPYWLPDSAFSAFSTMNAEGAGISAHDFERISS
jgi:hypothetical protein